MRINQYCTCDVANFGDVLYPSLFRHIAELSFENPDVRPHAFIPGKPALGGKFEVLPIRDLFQNDAAKHPLVIGGGDILRLDDLTVASHYLDPSTTLPSPQSYSLQQGPYRVTYHLGSSPPTDPRRVFKIERMPPVHGAFMLSPHNCPGASSVAYFSAGVPFDFCKDECPQVQAVFNEASFIYLRDEQSAEKLRKAGITRNIEVAPDIAVVISDLFPKASLSDIALELLSEVGLSLNQPYLCFQVSQATTASLPIIAQQLYDYSIRYGIPVVLLPLGLCHGDVYTLSRLASVQPQHFKLVDAQSIREMLAILAHAELFVGVSMHGNIAAFSYGVPHMFGVLGVDKISGAMTSLNLEPTQKLGDWNGLLTGLKELMNLDRTLLAKKQKAAKKQAYSVSERLLKSL